jgi:uncharacterized protein (DUF2252 family)
MTRRLEGFLAPRQTIDERLAAGKARRDTVPRKSLGVYTPGVRRPDPIAQFEAQNKTRLAELVPVRFARMLASPFAFLRGAAGVMASDLAESPTTGLTVQACGDVHVSNFGVFASAERQLVFGISDFDETLPGPWEWDLKRLTASAAVAAFHLGGDKSDAEGAARRASAAYRTQMREYARMGHVATWYDTIDETEVLASLSPRARRGAERILKKARTRTSLEVLGKLTELVDDRHQIVEQPPLIVRQKRSSSGRPIEEALDELLESYLDSLPWDRRPLLARYRILDIARKTVGVGSVGTRCWIVLLMGADEQDPIFLQVKQAQQSVLKPYVAKGAAYQSEGHRVVVGQRLIQGSPDIFLGWGKSEGRDFYVRQLRDMKGGPELEPGVVDLPAFDQYCRLCGWALALAHAKSGDAAAIAGYAGKSEALDEAMGTFALAYAEQNEQDYEALAAAARSGRIAVAKES